MLGEQIGESELDERGPAGDRDYAIVDGDLSSSWSWERAPAASDAHRLERLAGSEGMAASEEVAASEADHVGRRRGRGRVATGRFGGAPRRGLA